MSAITSATNPFADLGLAQPNATPKSKDLGQADFLRLMTEQLKNQDPLKPLESTAFLGQLAQFSTVQGIQDMQQSMGLVANVMESDQALRAAALVGHNALVQTETVNLAAGTTVDGVVATPSAGNVTVEISDVSGRLVRRMSIDAASSGEQAFAWDGRDDAGNAMAPGQYRIKATLGTGNAAQALPAMVNANIDSVSLDPQGLTVNLSGLGSWPLSAIRRIG